jgi:hypothetical protein
MTGIPQLLDYAIWSSGRKVPRFYSQHGQSVIRKILRLQKSGWVRSEDGASWYIQRQRKHVLQLQNGGRLVTHEQFDTWVGQLAFRVGDRIKTLQDMTENMFFGFEPEDDVLIIRIGETAIIDSLSKVNDQIVDMQIRMTSDDYPLSVRPEYIEDYFRKVGENGN